MTESARHIVVCTLPGYGHVTPVLDLFGELVCRGHRVTVATSEEFAGRIAATGAAVLRYAEPAGADPGSHRLAAALSGVTSCLAPLAPVHALFAADPPDVLAFDATMWVAGRVLARAVDCPTVQLCPCFVSNEHYSLPAHVAELDQPAASNDDSDTNDSDTNDGDTGDFGAELRALLDSVGGTSLDDLLSDARDRKVVLLPRELQYRGETFDARHTFTGPCFGPSRPLDGWTPPADGHPVLLVSLGTSAFNHQPDFFHRCAQAFAGLPWNLVMTLGGGVDPVALEPLPPNVQAHRWLPHPAVLRHARAFVTSAGMGSIMEALYCGTPLVLVPQHGEQEVNTKRVVELGLGRRIPRDDMTPERLRDTVLEVAADPLVRQRVERMREHCHRAGGTQAAADCLLAHPRVSAT